MAGGGQELSNACGAGRYPWAVWIVSVNLHSCRKALAILTIQIDLDGWCALTALNRSLGDAPVVGQLPSRFTAHSVCLELHRLS